MQLRELLTDSKTELSDPTKECMAGFNEKHPVNPQHEDFCSLKAKQQACTDTIKNS